MHHSRRDDGVDVAVAKGRDDLRQVLGGVLAVAVQQDHVIEIELHCMEVTEFLVSTVTAVEGRSEHAKVTKTQPLTGIDCRVERSVARRVVDDGDLGETRREPMRDAREDAVDEMLGVEGNDEDSDLRPLEKVDRRLQCTLVDVEVSLRHSGSALGARSRASEGANAARVTAGTC